MGKTGVGRVPLDPTDRGAVQNATASFLGRLVPLSRAVRLAENRRSMILANALEYPAYPEWRESSSTIVARMSNKRPSRAALAASIDKATWRELHALTVISVDKTSNGGPLALRNIRKDEDFDLWVGGLVAAGNGKLVDTTESVYHIPATMLTEPSQMVYEKGVRHAEAAEDQLRRAVSVYHKNSVTYRRARNAESPPTNPPERRRPVLDRHRAGGGAATGSRRSTSEPRAQGRVALDCVGPTVQRTARAA